MKTYTYDEVNAFIKELETGRNEIQNKISDLRGRRKTLKVWDFKGKQEIDKGMPLKIWFVFNCSNKIS